MRSGQPVPLVALTETTGKPAERKSADHSIQASWSAGATGMSVPVELVESDRHWTSLPELPGLGWFDWQLGAFDIRRRFEELNTNPLFWRFLSLLRLLNHADRGPVLGRMLASCHGHDAHVALKIPAAARPH